MGGVGVLSGAGVAHGPGLRVHCCRILNAHVQAELKLRQGWDARREESTITGLSSLYLEEDRLLMTLLKAEYRLQELLLQPFETELEVSAGSLPACALS